MIFNVSTERLVARNPVWARSFRMRLFGMIGRRFEPERMDAMLFENCSSIHTCWMRIPLDVLFLDAECRVTACFRSLRPWRIAWGGRRAVTVVELPAGAIAASGTENGHILNIRSEITPEAVEKSRREAILSQNAFLQLRSRKEI